MVKCSAPGKLVLAGEWALLERGNPAIIAAINKRTQVLIDPVIGKYVSLTVDEVKIRDIRFTTEGTELKLFPMYQVEQMKISPFTKAIETAFQYLQEESVELKPFKIRIWGEENQVAVGKEFRSINFGGSAAATAAIIKAVLMFHDVEIGPMNLFKLTCIACFRSQGRVGSGADIAAACVGGLFVYKRFDEDWLIQRLKGDRSLHTLLSEEWPRLEIETLKMLQGMCLDIGWTREVPSPELVAQFKEWAQFHKQECHTLYASIANLVREILLAWQKDDKSKILELIRQNHTLLADMGQKAGVGINTPGLQQLADIANATGGAGKLSGTGGGDGGIALSFDKATSETIRKNWKMANLNVVDAAIDFQGARSD